MVLIHWTMVVSTIKSTIFFFKLRIDLLVTEMVVVHTWIPSSIDDLIHRISFFYLGCSIFHCWAKASPPFLPPLFPILSWKALGSSRCLFYGLLLFLWPSLLWWWCDIGFLCCRQHGVARTGAGASPRVRHGGGGAGVGAAAGVGGRGKGHPRVRRARQLWLQLCQHRRCAAPRPQRR